MKAVLGIPHEDDKVFIKPAQPGVPARVGVRQGNGLTPHSNGEGTFCLLRRFAAAYATSPMPCLRRWGLSLLFPRRRSSPSPPRCSRPARTAPLSAEPLEHETGHQRHEHAARQVPVADVDPHQHIVDPQRAHHHHHADEQGEQTRDGHFLEVRRAWAAPLRTNRRYRSLYRMVDDARMVPLDTDIVAAIAAAKKASRREDDLILNGSKALGTDACSR